MNYKYGTVVKDDLIHIDTPFSPREDCLTEDLFQLLHNDFVLDVGWYNKERGDCFSIYIIKNENWEKPIYSEDVFVVNDLNNRFYYVLGIFDTIIRFCSKKQEK